MTEWISLPLFFLGFLGASTLLTVLVMWFMYILITKSSM